MEASKLVSGVRRDALSIDWGNGQVEQGGNDGIGGCSEVWTAIVAVFEVGDQA